MRISFLFLFSLLFNVLRVNSQTPKILLPMGHSSYENEEKTIFIKKGSEVLTTSIGETIQWDTESGRIHGRYVGYLMGTDSSKKIYTLDDKKQLLAWDLETGELLRNLYTLPDDFKFVKLSPNFRYLAFAAQTKFCLVDLVSKKRILNISIYYDNEIRNIDFDFSSTGIELYFEDQSFGCLFDCRTGQAIRKVPLPSCFDAKSNLLINVKGSELFVYDSRLRRQVFKTRFANKVESQTMLYSSTNLWRNLSVSESGKRILLRDSINGIVVWDLFRNQILFKKQNVNSIVSLVGDKYLAEINDSIFVLRNYLDGKVAMEANSLDTLYSHHMFIDAGIFAFTRIPFFNEEEPYQGSQTTFYDLNNESHLFTRTGFTPYAYDGHNNIFCGIGNELHWQLFDPITHRIVTFESGIEAEIVVPKIRLNNNILLLQTGEEYDSTLQRSSLWDLDRAEPVHNMKTHFPELRGRQSLKSQNLNFFEDESLAPTAFYIFDAFRKENRINEQLDKLKSEVEAFIRSNITRFEDKELGHDYFIFSKDLYLAFQAKDTFFVRKYALNNLKIEKIDEIYFVGKIESWQIGPEKGKLFLIEGRKLWITELSSFSRQSINLGVDVERIVLSPNEQVIGVQNDSLVCFINAQTTEFIDSISGFGGKLSFSPDSRLALLYYWGERFIYNFVDGKLEQCYLPHNLKNSGRGTEVSVISGAGKVFEIYTDVDNNVPTDVALLYSSKTFSRKTIPQLDGAIIVGTHLIQHLDRLLIARTAFADWESSGLILWDTKSNRLVSKTAVERESMEFAIYKEGVFIPRSNNISYHDLRSGELVYNFYSFGVKDYLIHLPTNYYKGPRSIVSKLTWRIGDKLVGFEQFDIKFNRPDKVLIAMRSADTTLIQLYKSVYEKRIARLGIDTLQFKEGFNVPNAELVNRRQLKSLQASDSVVLIIHAFDKKEKLKSFNVWINEVPMFGVKGLDVSYSGSTFDTSFSIRLSKGNNKIEYSVRNTAAVESFRSPLDVRYEPVDSVEEQTIYIGIGVNKYKNHPRPGNLSFAGKDIVDIGNLIAGNSKTTTYLFLDSSVKREDILALKSRLQKTSVHDRVIIALSGHGTLDDNRDFYFATYDIDFDNPEQRGLKYEELEDLLSDIPARKKLLLIDACHSGEIDTSTTYEDHSPSPKDPQVTGKGDPEKDLKASVGLDNSFELMKELFTDLTRGNGTVVISAARGSGYAEENEKWQNGAFTLCFKAAFEGNQEFDELNTTADANGDGVSINELKDYIFRTVPAITNSRQKPTTRRENISVDWHLW